MNTPDRSNGSPPSWPLAVPSAPAAKPPLPVASYEELLAEIEPKAPKLITAKLVGRALRRHWWQILIGWMVLSGVLMWLAATRIKPKYEATALLEVLALPRPIVGPSLTSPDFKIYQQTQVQRIRSPDIIAAALHGGPDGENPLMQLPRLRRAADPEAEILNSLVVRVGEGTSLIWVSTFSENPTEAAAIVNAVVGAYLRHAVHAPSHETPRVIYRQRLAERKEQQESEVERLQREVRRLSQTLGARQTAEATDDRTRLLNQYSRLEAQIHSAELEVLKFDAHLEQLRLDQQQIQQARGDTAAIDPDQMAWHLFLSQREVHQLDLAIRQAQRQYDHVSRMNRYSSDRSVQIARDELNELKTRRNELWRQMAPQLRAQVARGGVDETDRAIRDLERNRTVVQRQVAQFEQQRDALRAQLEELQRNAPEVDGSRHTIDLLLAQNDLQRARRQLETLQDTLDQAALEDSSAGRVVPVGARDPERGLYARVPGVPSSDRRFKIMAVVPFGVLALLTSLAVLLELHGARVGDADEVSSRAHVAVIGVVPPLPSPRVPRGLLGSRDPYRARRQLDEFVQSLDHLRVSLCTGRGWSQSGHRCVLITSAIGGEGKTTLAAQLAGRCANAGVSTLLIDADLRNPSLSRMLDVPDGPGLVDVLAGEVAPEATLVVIGSGGGFHLLPAGTPVIDPARLLEGDQLGPVLSRLREMFEVVIVDAPPVLPLPDALILGRWTDGAVVAVRRDASRFPLVEQAYRRLASVGVTVLGAVVNGVRPAGSSYATSSHYSNRYASVGPNGDDEIGGR